jgi:hypothetical protein
LPGIQKGGNFMPRMSGKGEEPGINLITSCFTVVK